MALRSRASRRSFAGITAVLALATALSGCSLLPPAQQALPSAQLKKELLSPPVGSRPYSRGTAAPGGVLTLDQYADAVSTVADRPGEKQSLTEAGFRYAVETNWHAPDGTSADLFVLQFGDSAGSADFVSSVSEGTATNRQPTEPLATLPNVSGGEYWTAGSVDSVGNIEQIAWYTVGNIAVDLHYFTPAVPNPTGLDDLATAQHIRLAGRVTTPAPAPSSTGKAAPAPASGAAADTPQDRNRLLHDLVPLPSGARPWDGNASDGSTGILTLQQLETRFTDGSDAKNHAFAAEQSDRGFQYAVREDWVAADGTQADVTLLQFATATGAQSFALDYQGGAQNAAQTQEFPIPGEPTGKGYEHENLTHRGYGWTEAYAVIGNIAVDIDFWRTAKPDRTSLTALTQQQLHTLESDPTVLPLWLSAPALPSPDS